ncbi:transport and Golgi organization protein 1 [Drosophila tropicalis]|uniref:transport and Golgi organization protein 1 n=1 Tax=Drosophila tropicalis TaxID=46794 RepID=UPI0035ABFFFE
MRPTNQQRENLVGMSDLRILALLVGLIGLVCLPSTTWAQTPSLALSDKRLCADLKCEQIISTGKARINYNAGGEGLLSLKINAPVRVLSKSAGSNKKMWGAEIGGRRGYVNKDFIMEQRILIRDADLKFEVPVVGPGSPKPVVDPVLNASETSDDLLTTTTSPLDLKVDAIVTEQPKAATESSVAAAPEPSKPNVQLVDGTELPLEALSAVTESAVETKPDDSLPTELNKPDESQPTSTEKVEEHKDSLLDLGTKEPLPAATEKVEEPLQTKEPLQVLTENVEEIKPENPLPVITEKVEDFNTIKPLPLETKKNEESKKEDPIPAATEKPNSSTESVPVVTEKVIKTEERKAEELQPDPYGEFSDDYDYEEDEDEEANEIESNKDELIENKKPIEVASLEKNLTDKIIDKNVDNVVQTEVPQVKVDNENEKEAAAPSTPITTTESSTETESNEKIGSEEKIAIPETSTEKVEIKKLEETAPHSVEGEKPLFEENVRPSEDSQADLNDLQSNEPAAPLLPIQQQQQPQVADPILISNSVETKTDSSLNVDSSSTSEPLQVEEIPVSLPPLFNKQNFENPNDYYKQMQEQQLRLQQEQQQTTPSPFNSPYEAIYDAEPTPAPILVTKEEQLPPAIKTETSTEQIDDISSTLAKSAEISESTEQASTTQEEVAQELPPAPRHYDDTPSLAPPTDGVGSVEPVPLPSTASPLQQPSDLAKESAGLGLFATIVDTVNSFISTQDGSKEPETDRLSGGDELHRILYSNGGEPAASKESPDVAAEGYCSRNINCPRSTATDPTITLDNFVEIFGLKVLEHSQLLLCVVIAAVSSLCFIFTYYCCCNSSQEGALLAKVNQLERSLLASHKENAIIKHDLMTTRQKLASIEDNSFGSNDMVASLKKQLETELYEKAKLQEQVGSLERDLDNAAEAGLELNKMLSEVLNSQNGDEAFINTVDELQRQLNDQEKIIIDINSSLAEKSRENSELQYTYTEHTARLTSEMNTLQQENYELEMEKAKLQTSLDGLKVESEQELAKSLEARNYEMQKLQNQILDLNSKWEKEHNDLQTSIAKIDALEECLKAVKKDANLNVQELITSAKTKGELNAAQKKFSSLQQKLEKELSAKARLEQQLKQSGVDVEQLKQDYNQSERDKLEAQTRLEVLSGYFREKETQLQKELSLQEAKWLQHQGETSSTVETQTLMKNEIQLLKSQNDELRAEIEAQIASHKAQMGTLENRAHESWLAARQSERRCEEALAEAAGLRRKLTAMASGRVGGGEGDADITTSSNGGGETTAPSPLPLVAPGSPLLNMQNPLPFLPAPFPPFLGLPPPFLPPNAGGGGARPPPLGRMRSPPPSGRDRDRDRDRYSDYSDYDDYDDDEDDRGSDHRRRHSGSWGRGSGGGGRRNSYVHSPRTYRSLSPSDSRYNYNDTETDFSPPPSPPLRTRHRVGGGSGSGGSRPINEV